MSVTTLYDSSQDICVLYCTTSDEPLQGATFQGAEAREQAESFLGWLRTGRYHDDLPGHRHLTSWSSDPTDPRTYTEAGRLQAVAVWADECLDEDGIRLNGYGWNLYEWYLASCPAAEEPAV